MPVIVNSASAAKHTAALIQCHRCVVRYSCLSWWESICVLLQKGVRTLHEKNSYLQPHSSIGVRRRALRRNRLQWQGSRVVNGDRAEVRRLESFEVLLSPLRVLGKCQAL